MLPWLVLWFPVVMQMWRWLPCRETSALAWVVLWALGMLLWRGYGAMAMS